jgi:hypothetical protein
MDELNNLTARERYEYEQWLDSLEQQRYDEQELIEED